MRFTLSWLRDFLNFSADLPTMLDAIGQLGHEVEEVVDHSKQLAPFMVAEIIHAEQHPNADKLRVCKVNTGKETLQIVCGASNARAGIKVVLAPIGSIIPTNQMQIKASSIRGVDSQGMMCSAEELGIRYGENAGIIELPHDAEVGAPAAIALGMADPIVSIDITPNRGDVASMMGIARELAALGTGTLIPPAIPHIPESMPCPIALSVEAKEACPHFAIRVIEGIRNGDSPAWLKQRLLSVGIEPISLVVDVTNYIAHSYGQPMHVYDADKITGKELRVRYAKEGEKLLALNKKEYALTSEMLVVADNAGPLGLAGVMGGEASGWNETTQNICLEAAYFTPESVMPAGRQLQIISEARYRFERHINPAFTNHALDIATDLILSIAGGKASVANQVTTQLLPMPAINFSIDHIASLAGVKVEEARVIAILTALGCQCESLMAGRLHVIPPMWRHDLAISEDLVEEVMRVIGYDHIPALPCHRDHTNADAFAADTMRMRFTARRLLAGRGLTELVNWSFTRTDAARAFGGGSEALQLLNPISMDLIAMRPSMVPLLLDAISRNQARSMNDLGFFEIGPVFHGTKAEEQPYAIAIAITGLAMPRNCHSAIRPIDFYDMKAHVEALCDAYGVNASALSYSAENTPSWLHPGKSARLVFGNKTTIAVLGELHPSLVKQWDLQGPVVVAELYPHLLPIKRFGKKTGDLTLSKFPMVERDFAFIVDAKVTAEQLLAAIRKAEPKMIHAIQLFDVYKGKGIPEGKQSLAVMVALQPVDRTFTDEEIQTISNAIISQVQRLVGGELRGSAA